MLGRIKEWLLSFFRKGDLFSERERRIYKYHDGEKFLHADPMVLDQVIADKFQELKADFAAAVTPSQWSRKCQKDVVSKLRIMFGIRPLYANPVSGELMFSIDPDGKRPPTLDNVGVLDLFTNYMVWSEGVKKNSSPTLIPVPETSAPTDSSQVDGSNTLSSSVSGSVASDPIPEPAAPLPKESALLSAASPPEINGSETIATESANLPG